jgi:hypothetical protein
MRAWSKLASRAGAARMLEDKNILEMMIQRKSGEMIVELTASILRSPAANQWRFIPVFSTVAATLPLSLCRKRSNPLIDGKDRRPRANRCNGFAPSCPPKVIY